MSERTELCICQIDPKMCILHREESAASEAQDQPSCPECGCPTVWQPAPAAPTPSQELDALGRFIAPHQNSTSFVEEVTKVFMKAVENLTPEERGHRLDRLAKYVSSLSSSALGEKGS